MSFRQREHKNELGLNQMPAVILPAFFLPCSAESFNSIVTKAKSVV